MYVQDGITAFEALESGVLPPLRELLAWLETAATCAAASRSSGRPRLVAEAKVATTLERDAVGALAIVSSRASGTDAKNEDGIVGSVDEEGLEGRRRVSSEAVLQVMDEMTVYLN